MTMDGDDEGLAATAMQEIRSWLHAETFEGLAEVNGKCLELVTDQARTRAVQPHPMLRELGELWRTLDPASRRRAACCPYLVVDAGFSDSRRWRILSDLTVHETPRAYGSFFTVPRATEVSRLVFTYAWHLARSHNLAARVLLGMPSETASLIASCTLPQISEFAEKNSSWLRPRWPGRVQVWREFLMTAATGEGLALERARLHGLQLLAGESLTAQSRAEQNVM